MATETYTPDDQAVKLTGNAASLARRYSEALYDLAQEQKQMDAVSADIHLLHQIAHDSAEFVMIASNPRLTPAQRLLFRRWPPLQNLMQLRSIFWGFWRAINALVW